MRRASAVAIILGAVAFSAPREAGADPTPSYYERWYGWSTFGSDALGVGVTALGIKVQSTALVVGGATSWLVGAPLIHFAHGHRARGGIDFFVRSIPWGGMVAAGVASKSASFRCDDIGCVAGIGAASVFALVMALVDAGISFDDVPPPPPQTALPIAE